MHVEIGRNGEGLLSQVQLHNPVDTEVAQALAQVAEPDHIPPAPTVNECVRVDLALNGAAVASAALVTTALRTVGLF